MIRLGVNYVEEYYRLIAKGEIVTSQKVKKIYERLIYDINNPDKYYFDTHKATKPIAFIETFCKLSDGELNQSFTLDLWQKAYIQSLFGFVDSEGNRRFRETLLIVGRKNGKSQLASAIALYMLIADGEAGANIYSAATKRDQARLIFDATLKMVKQSPALSKHLKKRKNDLYFEANFSKMEPLASEARTLEGLNSHLIIIDELHCLQTRAIYDVLKRSTSAKSRKQPLLFMITTAGTIREAIYDELYEYGCKVIDASVVDDKFLPIFYELDSEREWDQPGNWAKANPGLDTIKSRDYLVNEVAKAKANPLNKSDLLCKDFNIRQSPTSSWLTFNQINNETTFDINDFRNTYAIGGVDLSATTDLSCATLIVKKPDSSKIHVHQMYWLPSAKIHDNETRDKIPYEKWVERGLMRISGKNKIDYDDIVNWFVEMHQKHDIYIPWVYFDTWGADSFRKKMDESGFNMQPCRQGFRTLSQPFKELTADFLDSNIIYNNNPILKWCLTNVETESDPAGNIKPVKGRDNRRRIDGLVSLLIAYVGLQVNIDSYKNLIEG